MNLNKLRRLKGAPERAPDPVARARDSRRSFALPGIKKITLAMLKGAPAR